MSIYDLHFVDFAGHEVAGKLVGKTGYVLTRALGRHIIGNGNLHTLANQFVGKLRGFLSYRINNKHHGITGLFAPLVDDFERAFKQIHVECATQSLVRAEHDYGPPLHGTYLGER